MSRMLVCIDCGAMETTAPVEYLAPQGAAVEGENEFATKMVTTMGFVYLGCPACKSPNVFLQPVNGVTEAIAEVVDEEVDEEVNEEIDVSDMMGDEEDEEIEEEPKPVVVKKKKTKNKLRARRRIGTDGQIATEYAEDTIVSTDDGIEDLEFKRGPPQPRRMYKRECKTPSCNRDFETKHSFQGYCPKCLKRFTGG